MISCNTSRPQLLLLPLAIACGLVTIARATVCADPPIVQSLVDLSQDFVNAPAFNRNSGAASVEGLASQNPLVRTVLVVEHGQLVSEYVRGGDDAVNHRSVDPSRPYPIWSATKSWMGLIIGMLAQDGLLSIDETLGDIFDDPTDWDDVVLKGDGPEELEFRKSITIQQMLTMSSGLHTPDFFMGAMTTNVDAVSMDDLEQIGFYHGGSMGGANVSDSLADPDIAPSRSKSFRYIPANNILSYVVQKRTGGGMTPRQFADAYLFPRLGIRTNEMDWWQNQDGMEYSYHGLSLTTRQMAKWGQLYLQQGKSNPAGTQLIDEEWIQTSTSTQTSSIMGMYGYLTWVHQHPDSAETIFCASGMGGQQICVSRMTGRVVVQQRDLPLFNNASQPVGTADYDVSMLALDPMLSFTD